MAVLADVERFLERVFERSTARLFRAHVQPVQLERRVERAMERARSGSGGRTVVPGRYRVRVQPDDLRAVADQAGGAEALEWLLSLEQPPTAIVCSTDTLAFGVLHTAYSRGRRVPADLSVVGFDDVLLASHTVPALTTLRMPVSDIVAHGLDLAIGLARQTSPSSPPPVKILPPKLIIRQSTGPAPSEV